MYRKSMLVVLVCILALGFSRFSVVEGKSSKKTFTWNRKERQIFTVSGGRFVVGHEKFAEEIRKVLPRTYCWGTSRSLLYLVKNQRTIENFHNIFMIRPEYLYHFEELEAEYPHLMPDSYENLKSYLKSYSYSLPLLYFSFDTTKRKIRGIIIAKKVTPTLATKLLTEKAIPLNTPLQYEKGELKKAEKKKLENTFTWNYKERLIITVTARPRVSYYDEFAQELRKVFGRELNRWGAPSLLTFTQEKERLEVIRSHHTIFMIRPECLYDFQGLEAEYPDLLPVSYEKLKAYLKSYSYPLLYFSRDYTGMLRGVIIAREVTPSLAKALTEKPIPLDTLLQYENEELKLKMGT